MGLRQAISDGVSRYAIVRNPVGRIQRIDRIHGIEFALYEDESGRSSWRRLLPANPILIKHIELTRFEGPIHQCEKTPELVTAKEYPGDGREGSLFKDAWQIAAPNVVGTVLRSWSVFVSRGYDKCGFVVEWVDGRKYQGRYDLYRWTDRMYEEFADTFRHRLLFYAGLLGYTALGLRDEPHRFKSNAQRLEEYMAIVDGEPSRRDYCRETLAKYEV